MGLGARIRNTPTPRTWRKISCPCLTKICHKKNVKRRLTNTAWIPTPCLQNFVFRFIDVVAHWWRTRLLRQRSWVRIRHLPQWSWCAAGSLWNNVEKSQGRDGNLPLRQKKIFKKKFPPTGFLLLFYWSHAVLLVCESWRIPNTGTTYRY